MCRHNLQFHIKEFLRFVHAFLKSLENYCLESALREHYSSKKKNTKTETPYAISIQLSSLCPLLHSPLLIIFPTGKCEGWIEF